MKQWTVYYRNANGTEESQVFEADGKPEVFAILKQKGISAVRIVEGASAASRRNAAVAPSAKRGLVAGLAVVILAVGAYFLFFSESGKPEKARPGKSSSAIKEVKPAAGPKAVLPNQPAAAGKEASSVPTRASGRGTVPGSAAEGSAPIEQQTEHPKTRRTFEHGTDQLIAMAMTSAQGGGAMPPLPNIGSAEDKEFKESLKKPIVINDDDPDNVKNVKQLVQQTREEIIKLMEENPNMSFSDILQEHRNIHNDNVDIRAQATKELQKIIDEGDIEGAVKFRTTMNLALQQMGISEITTPITEEEKAAVEADQNNEN